MAKSKEMVDYRNYFLAYDKNGDGKLDREEFKQMLRSMGMKFNDLEMAKAFRAVDADKSGTITFNEFAEAYLKSDKKYVFSHARANDVFKVVDRNNDGSLTKDKCVEAMRMLGMKMDESGVKRVMKLMDKNEDGLISYSEFIRFCEV